MYKTKQRFIGEIKAELESIFVEVQRFPTAVVVTVGKTVIIKRMLFRNPSRQRLPVLTLVKNRKEEEKRNY